MHADVLGFCSLCSTHYSCPRVWIIHSFSYCQKYSTSYASDIVLN